MHAAPSINVEDLRFSLIESYLSQKKAWKIKTEKEASGYLLKGFSRLGAKGISAYWGWGITDAIVAPENIWDIAEKGDVVWIGKYTSTGPDLALIPFAVVFLNSRTGEMKIFGELPKKAEQGAAANP